MRTHRFRIHHVLLAALVSLTASVATSGTLHAQDLGEIRGTVTDSESGEPIVRATISLRETKLGAYSDLKGGFAVRKVPKGVYTIVISSIGFQEHAIADVLVDGTKRLEVALTSMAIQGREVTVTGRRSNQSEAALLNLRRNAGAVSDGISMAQIRRSPDATSGESLNRVTGLSLVSNRFVTIRGTNERYNNAQLNGVSMTSTEPDKRAFSFDLFPANLLENTVVSKTFLPDMPGDFSGGLVQLNTVDFPESATLRVSVGGSHGSRTTFASLEGAQGGARDWIGFDDGARALPTSFPLETLDRANFEQSEIDSFARMLPNSWSRATSTARPNANLLLSFGDQYSVLDNDVGVLAAVTYRAGQSHSPITRRDVARFDYSGIDNAATTLWGAMANLSVKLDGLHTLSARNVYTRAAENRLTYLAGADLYTGQYRERHGLYFLERGFYTGQLAGEHAFPSLNAMRVNWRAFASIGERSEPDFRRATYLRPDANDTTQPLMLAVGSAPNPSAAGRYYSTLDDKVFGGGGDVTIPFARFKVKTGAVVENKQRYFAARQFGYVASASEWQFTTASLDTVFDPTHIGPDGLTLVETTASSDRYDAHSNVSAAYAMADLPFDLGSSTIRAIVGARYEASRQIINTASRSQAEPIVVDYRVEDILPSVNLMYQPSEQLNIRLAYSRTVARPELREFAGFSFYDFTTDQLVYGNPEIRRALISNYDLRVELFPGLGELMAVSLFHKEFEDAVEAVAITGDIPERTWANADRARNTGIELELRRNLAFLDSSLSDLSFSANYTWLESRVDVAGTDMTATKSGRRLQGQSPYMINAGVYYDNEALGTSASILYNCAGERISEVARSEQPDFVEQPRDVLDVSVSQLIAGRYEVKLAIRDLLAQDQVFTQDGVPARISGRETVTSLSFSFKF